MVAVFIDQPMPDDERRQRLHQGDLFIYSPTQAMTALADLARRMLEDAFAPHDPRGLDRSLDVKACVAVLASLKPEFIHHPACKILIPKIVEELGGDPERTYYDLPRLRSAYPGHYLTSGIAYAFHAHRDTWYAAPDSQINWWMPVHELSPDNCLVLYPRYFSEPVRNTSAHYNHDRWIDSSRYQAAKHVHGDTREQPKLLQELDDRGIRLLCPPGGLILFSAAHLHATVPNVSGVARYSIDFRTVHRDDIKAHRGARNLDNRSTGSVTKMREYLRCPDLQPLPEAIFEFEPAPLASASG